MVEDETPDDDIKKYDIRIDDPYYMTLLPVVLALIGIVVVIVRKKKSSK